MHGARVVRLIEIIRPEFPVGVELHTEPIHTHSFFELMILVELGRWRQVGHQVGGVVIHGVPDEASPGRHSDLGECELANRISLEIAMTSPTSITVDLSIYVQPESSMCFLVLFQSQTQTNGLVPVLVILNNL